MLPLLRIFGLTIQTPLLASLLGFSIGLYLVTQIGATRQFDPNILSSAGFYGLIVGVAGSRIGYVIANIRSYAAEPLSALMPGTTAMLPVVGWITGIVFGVIYLYRKKLLKIELLDIASPGIAFLLAGSAASSFLSGDDFGTVANLPWSVYLWGEWRHPVQLYELIASCALVVLLYQSLQRQLPDGTSLLLLIGLYGFTRTVIDAYRVESIVVLGVRLSQVVGVSAAVLAFWLIGQLDLRHPKLDA